MRIFHAIIQENPNSIFTSGDLMKEFNRRCSDKFGPRQVSMILFRLFKKGKIIRTKTQTDDGFVYSMQNKEALDKLYLNYLLPYDFSDKSEIINLISKNPSESIRNNTKIPNIERFSFFQKYSKNHFNQESTKEFLAKLVAFIMGDGSIGSNTNRISFFFKEKQDAEDFKKDFIKNDPNTSSPIPKRLELI